MRLGRVPAGVAGEGAVVAEGIAPWNEEAIAGVWEGIVPACRIVVAAKAVAGGGADSDEEGVDACGAAGAGVPAGEGGG